MRRLFETRGPKSINFAVLLTAPKKKRKVEVDVKWSGFNIGEKFVVGYGLDLASKYRNLPYIAELKLDVIKKFL
jgi:hypoxanthine phosphoribosyltransferase